MFNYLFEFKIRMKQSNGIIGDLFDSTIFIVATAGYYYIIPFDDVTKGIAAECSSCRLTADYNKMTII